MSSKNLQTKLTELKTIVDSFESGSMDVEIALEKFEIGSKLSEEIEKDLTDLKTKVTVLKKRFDSE